MAVVRCTFLLEARSSSYGAYLRSILPERMHRSLETWESEEEHHGRALRRWLDLADPGFASEPALDSFRLAPYHENASNDRGGATREIAARCVIEALASGFYLALAEQVREPLLREMCLRLSQDERRHHRQFLQLLRQTEELSTTGLLVAMFKRTRELENEQISVAAEMANGDSSPVGAARNTHFLAVYGLFGRRHIEYVLEMVWEVAGLDPGPRLASAATRIVEAELRLKMWRLRARILVQRWLGRLDRPARGLRALSRSESFGR